jgi:hypothetical protein
MIGFVKKLGTDSRACIAAIGLQELGTALQSVPNFFHKPYS